MTAAEDQDAALAIAAGRFADSYLRARPLFFSLIRSQEAALFEAYQDLLRSPVLDVGCGDGFFAHTVLPGRQIEVGLDVPGSRLDEARRSGAYRQVTVYDGRTIPYPDGRFASAMSNCVLEHVLDLDRVLAEIARVLRPGGHFLTSVMTDRWEEHLFGTKLAGARYKEFMRRRQEHRNLLSLEDWSERFAGAGFEEVTAIGYLSARTSRYMDLFHYLSAPSLLVRALSGQWVVLPGVWSALLRQPVQRLIELPVLPEESSAVFFVLRRANRGMPDGRGKDVSSQGDV